MFDKIKTYLEENYDINASLITPATKFSELEISSFEFVEMCAELEDELGIEIEDEKLANLFTIGDLTGYIEKRLEETNR